MEYYEEEFKISTQPNLLFKFKEMSPILILNLATEMEIYAGSYDSEVYMKYLASVLENTQVKVNGTYIPLKEGNNYYPVYMKKDLKGLREISNRFFEEIIKPTFQGSSESTTEQK